jgi:hypothetical protein
MENMEKAQQMLGFLDVGGFFRIATRIITP